MIKERAFGRASQLVRGWLGLWLIGPAVALAHCDGMDGPVVTAAKRALENGQITPVLSWVKPEYEDEVHQAFTKTLAVRKLSPEARELADLYFFETVVRVHRLGEGEGFTGLKPAGTDPGPAVTAADRALETGSADDVVKLVTNEVAAGVRARFQHAVETRKSADQSVQAGREFVAAYVEFVHYVERLHQDAKGAAGHHAAAEGARPEHTHAEHAQPGGSHAGHK